MDVKLTVTIELGRTRDTIENVMEYGDQSLIELDRSVGEPVEVLVNGELFAVERSLPCRRILASVSLNW